MENGFKNGVALAAAMLLASCTALGNPPVVFLAEPAGAGLQREIGGFYIDPMRLAAAGLYDFEQLDALAPARIDPRLATLEAAPSAPIDLAAHDAAFVDHFGGAGFRNRVAGIRLVAADGTTAIASGATPAGWTRIAEDRFRHLASGLECPLALRTGGEHPGRFDLTAVMRHDARNMDVSCLYRSGGAAMLSVHAVSWPETSLETHAASALAALRARVSGARPLPLISTRNGSASQRGDALAAAIDAGAINGEPYKAAVWIATIGDWHIKSSAFYPQADSAAERISAMHFAFSRDQISMNDQSGQASQEPAFRKPSL